MTRDNSGFRIFPVVVLLMIVSACSGTQTANTEGTPSGKPTATPAATSSDGTDLKCAGTVNEKGLALTLRFSDARSPWIRTLSGFVIFDLYDNSGKRIDPFSLTFSVDDPTMAIFYPDGVVDHEGRSVPGFCVPVNFDLPERTLTFTATDPNGAKTSWVVIFTN